MSKQTVLDEFVELYDIVSILQKRLETEDTDLLIHQLDDIRKNLVEMKKMFLSDSIDAAAFKEVVLQNRNSVKKIVAKTDGWLRKHERLIRSIQIWRDYLDEMTPIRHGMFRKFLDDSVLYSDVKERGRRQCESCFANCY